MGNVKALVCRNFDEIRLEIVRNGALVPVWICLCSEKAEMTAKWSLGAAGGARECVSAESEKSNFP